MSRIAILTLAALFCATSPAATTIRIACGSSTGGVDAAGNLWQPDAHFSGGTDYSRANMAALDLPYRALRYGAFTYSLPTTAGQYTVTLYFLENRTAASDPQISPGQRKIAVTINGTVVIPSLDLYAVAGSLVPYSAKLSITATGPLVITIAPVAGSLAALLSGIQVDSVDVPPPPITGAAWPRSCEYSQGFGRPVPPLDGQMFSGVTLQAGCWNITGSPRSLSSFRCRADGATDVTVDLLVPGPAGLVSVLPNGPVACSKDGLPSLSSPPSGQSFTPVKPVDGAKYADGEVLYFIVNVKSPVQLPDGSWQMSPAWVIWVVEFGQ